MRAVGAERRTPAHGEERASVAGTRDGVQSRRKKH
jgi:hypothetical protein